MLDQSQMETTMFSGSFAIAVTDEAADKATLATALSLAEAAGAHLDIHCIGLDPTRYEALPAGAGAMVIEIGVEEAQARADALVAWATAQIPAGQARVAVQSLVVSTAGLDVTLARAVRYADLVITGRPYGPAAAPLAPAQLEAALFETSAPVLVALGKVAAVPTRPMVAWDESPMSMQAIRAALPVLRAAGRVDVVMVDPPTHSPERSDPGGAISLMLARHGITAEVAILSKTMPRVSENLLRFATEHGTDLIVMGAYGHSRLREAVFGGVTRDLLEHATVPLLMAH